jgi:hypothetical protein
MCILSISYHHFLEPAILAVNLDKHYKPGLHSLLLRLWMSRVLWFLWLFTNQLWDYLVPSTSLQFLKYNRHRLQGLRSNTCGHCCCMSYHLRDQGQPMTSYAGQITTSDCCRDDKKIVWAFRQQLGCVLPADRLSSVRSTASTSSRWPFQHRI